MHPQCRLRVALVDDHAVVRAGYRRLLELEPDLEVVAEYGDAPGCASALADGMALDLLVLDISMPGPSGIDLLRRLRDGVHAVRVLVFTMHDTAAMLEQCMNAGATGYVTKSSAPHVLVDAVRRVARGEPAFSPDIAALRQQHPLKRAPHQRLSQRELDVFRRLLAGEGIEQIAAAMQLNAKTVANYQALVRHKLGVHGTVGLWQYARRHGLLG